jgi:hypothetical protein
MLYQKTLRISKTHIYWNITHHTFSSVKNSGFLDGVLDGNRLKFLRVNWEYNM